MSGSITDRRLGGRDRSVENRQRFLQRIKEQLKRSAKDIIVNGNIEDILGQKSYKVSVKRGSIYEPKIIFKPGTGDTKAVHPGNRQYKKGDTVPKPQDMEGQGGSSDDIEGEDDFTFIMTQEEFVSLFFDDLALPKLLKTHLLGITRPKWRRGGIAKEGVPPRLNYLRTLRQALGRKLVLKKPKQIERHDLSLYLEEIETWPEGDPKKQEEMKWVKEQIAELERRIKAVPYIDYPDLRYNRLVKENKPHHRAVMFCLMDVSGSMGDHEKTLAKKFFLLQHAFLKMVYKEIEVVRIRYHGMAREVDEEEFFYATDSGGTVVSSAFDKMDEIIRERYDSSWNMYVCHASDGDNHEHDEEATEAKLHYLLPQLQYYAYVQVVPTERELLIVPPTYYTDKELWRLFNTVSGFKNVGIGMIAQENEIWPVFKKLFSKEGVDV